MLVRHLIDAGRGRFWYGLDEAFWQCDTCDCLGPRHAMLEMSCYSIKINHSLLIFQRHMALLDILHYPDKRLHQVAKPVKVVDDRIRKLVADMAETMYDAPGVGLAATQVNVHERVVVMDVSEEKDELMVLINPEIIERSEEFKTYEEGCLSVPGFYDEVERPAEVRVRALDLEGKSFEFNAGLLLAVCIQHEIDHLNGKVFVQHLSMLKQTRLKARLRKEQRELERD